MLLAIGLFFYACKDLEDEEIEEQKKQLLEKEQQKQPPQKQDEQEQQKQQPLKKAKKLVAGNFTFELNDNSASKDAQQNRLGLSGRQHRIDHRKRPTHRW